jgi:hypothetical protein
VGGLVGKLVVLSIHEELKRMYLNDFSTKQNKTKQNKTKQNKTKQNKTKQNKTKQSDVCSTLQRTSHRGTQ